MMAVRGKAAEKPASKKPPAGAVREITDDDLRQLAANHRPKYEKLLVGKKAADKALQDLGKLIKADLGDNGLAIIKAMIELDTPEGETKVKARISAQATAMAWSSHDLGTQILLNLETPDRQPASDRAYDAGKHASMNNKPRKPPHDPSTPQYKSWLDGFTADQERQMATLGRGKDESGDTTDVRPDFLKRREAETAKEKAH